MASVIIEIKYCEGKFEFSGQSPVVNSNSHYPRKESLMFKERRQIIGEMLNVKAFVSLNELKTMFPDVSEMTLRRDIEYLEKRGDAIKVHGGARSTHFVTLQTDDPYLSRMNENTSAKIRIAKAAAEMLLSGRSIFMDSGTTVQKMVQFIPNERFTFTTTGPQTALELCRIGQPAVNLVGGILDRDNQAVSGMQALMMCSAWILISLACPWAPPRG